MRRIKDLFGSVFFPGSGRHAVDRATEFVDPYAAARQVHESQSVVAVDAARVAGRAWRSEWPLFDETVLATGVLPGGDNR